MASIRPRERSAIIQSLRAGVTPRTGLEYIQVGRVNEVKALIEDLDNISDGTFTRNLQETYLPALILKATP